jgi:hypothetical protein
MLMQVSYPISITLNFINLYYDSSINIWILMEFNCGLVSQFYGNERIGHTGRCLQFHFERTQMAELRVECPHVNTEVPALTANRHLIG